MESLVSACRYCPKIKYNFTCGKELTSAPEECCSSDYYGQKLYQTLRPVVNIQQTRMKQYSFLINTQTAMIMITMTMLIRNPTHQI
jgi:hypothetical protein